MPTGEGKRPFAFHVRIGTALARFSGSLGPGAWNHPIGSEGETQAPSDTQKPVYYKPLLKAVPRLELRFCIQCSFHEAHLLSHSPHGPLGWLDIWNLSPSTWVPVEDGVLGDITGATVSCACHLQGT